MKRNELEALPASSVIRLRTSRRTYRPGPLPALITERIRELAAAATSGPLGTRLRFSVIDTGDMLNRKLKLGTYGFIQGAGLFIAGQVAPSVTAFLDYGYVLESMILDLTRMGLGTCWLGGTFDRGGFARAIGLNEGCIIPAITPVGYATTSRGLGERIIRLGAGAKNRLPWEKLFFGSDAATPLNPGDDDPVRLILESVRIGPSASNLQPWRFVTDGKRFDLFLQRKPGYQKAFARVDIQMLDMGIAMAHFELVAREKGLITDWRIMPETQVPVSWEYVISVFLTD